MQQYIGIDVGGTHVKYGVINSDGEELTHHQFDTPEDASTFTRKWQDVVARCQQDYDIAAIGVSFPGHINPHNGHAAKAGALAYRRRQPTGVVQRADRSAAGRGERRELRGAGRNVAGRRAAL